MSLKILDPNSHPIKGLMIILTISGIRVENKKFAFFVAMIWFAFGVVSLGQLFYSAINLTDNMDDLFVLVHHTTLFSTLIISVVWSYIKRDNWEKIVNEIHLIFDYESKIMMKKVEELKINRQKRLKMCLTLVLFFMSFNHMNMIVFSYVERMFGNKEFILFFPIATPLDMKTWFSYSLVYLWENMVIGCILITVFGILDVLTVFYDKLSTEIILFKYAIRTTEKRAKEIMKRSKLKYSHIPDDKLYERSLIFAMNQCGRHHTLIVDYFSNAVEVISFSFFVIVIVGLTALVCAGAAMIFGSTFIKIKFGAILLVTYAFLYITFNYGESTREMGYSIPWLVYDIDWLNMPKECHSTLRLIMVRSMRPLEIKTTLGQKVDLENFMDLVKASYTYFNMIYQASQSGDLM